MKIRIKTLVDVTRTDVRRKGVDDKKFLQQLNYQTLLQIINLRNLIDNNDDPWVETRDITGEFGSSYKGEHRVWTYEFEVEHTDAYKHGDDPIGFLKQDFDLVPVLGGLEETVPTPKTFIVNHRGKSNITIEIDK